MQLPPTMQLESLSLEKIQVQLQPGDGLKGILVNQQALKHLKLHSFVMREGADRLAAALNELPRLEHLHVTLPRVAHATWDVELPFPGTPCC